MLPQEGGGGENVEEVRLLLPRDLRHRGGQLEGPAQELAFVQGTHADIW